MSSICCRRSAGVMPPYFKMCLRYFVLVCVFRTQYIVISILKVVSAEMQESRGRIRDTLAKAICNSSAVFAQSKTISPPLTNPRLFSTSRYDGGECTAFKWNLCRKTITDCSKFEPVNCQSVKATGTRCKRLSKTTTGRVIGGTDARPNQYPHQIRFKFHKDPSGKYTSHNGAGVLYNDRYVLTAAHVVRNKDSLELIAVAGDHHMKSKDPYEQERELAAITIHPDYVQQGTKHHDIAVVKVKTPFIINSKVHPPRLPDRHFEVCGEAELSGWGHINSHDDIDENDNDADWNDVLQRAVLPIIPNSVCAAIILDRPISEKQICAGTTGHNACQGDSGGPLTLVDTDGTQVAVGIVSYGTANCNTSWPTVYVRISEYRDWIAQTIEAMDKQP